MGYKVVCARALSPSGWTRLQWVVMSCVAALAVFALNHASAQAVIVVQPGDTFSGIAARFIGDARKWRQMYSEQDSGLPNPNLILIGQRFEVVSAADGSKYLRVVGGGAVAARTVAPTAVAKQAVGPTALPETLVVGVLPNIAAEKLMARYENLKRYLERVNDNQVRIVVPANFKAFFDSTMKGEYDLAISAPNLARVAQMDANLIPLAMYEPRINALFVAPINSQIKSGRDVRGQTVAFANPQSLVAMYGQQWLKSLDLVSGKDYEVKAARTDMGVGRMMLLGEAVAAIMSEGEFMSLPPDELAQMHAVEVFARIPNFVVLGNPRLGRAPLERVKTELEEFLADQKDGAAFKSAGGVTGIVEPNETTLRELDAFVAQTRQAMGVVK